MAMIGHAIEELVHFLHCVLGRFISLGVNYTKGYEYCDIYGMAVI